MAEGVGRASGALRSVCVPWALTLLCGAGLAEMVFDGVVTRGDAQFVLAHVGGVMDEGNGRVGDRVQPGQALASIQTTRVYADVEGKKASCKEAGIEYTINQIDEYRACGINGIHLYALNKYEDVARIAKEAGLLDLA